MDVFLQRLDQEYGIAVIATAPTVPYKVVYIDGTSETLSGTENFPDVDDRRVKALLEPMASVRLTTPSSTLSSLMKLLNQRRASNTKWSYLSDSGKAIVPNIGQTENESEDQQSSHEYENRILIEAIMPLSEIISNFYDRVKQLSSGYAMVEYDELEYAEADLVKISILLNGKAVPGLSVISHRSVSAQKARQITSKLKDLIPKQLFQVAIQASIGHRIIARETIPALRKDVTAKCYGGDFSRKRKLLERQKEGKKRMKSIGNVSIPHDTFVTLLKQTEES